MLNIAMVPLNEEYLHKAAVALNNSGVTMLQHQCYREAMDTFKNSFELLKACLNAELRCESIRLTMNNFLRKASENMIRALKTEISHENNGFQLNVLSFDPYRDFHSLNDAANTCDSEFTGYAIIMSQDEAEQNIKSIYYTASIQTQCAIVLNNITTASIAFGTKSIRNQPSIENSHKIMVLYRRGLDLGTTSFEILSRQLNGERDYAASRYQSALTMLVLKNLMRISLLLSDIQLSREFYVKFCNIRDDASFIDYNYCGGGLFQSSLAPVA
jgi:hypothetical protein